MKIHRKRLADSELEVMLIIWQYPQKIHTGEILKIVNHKKDRSTLQAVQSILKKLLTKGYVHCDKVGRLNYYLPLISENDYRDIETKSFIDKLYQSSPAKLITNLLDKEEMSETEITEIKRILDKDD
jgi:predicted transcriptional regulator